MLQYVFYAGGAVCAVALIIFAFRGKRPFACYGAVGTSHFCSGMYQRNFHGRYFARKSVDGWLLGAWRNTGCGNPACFKTYICIK